MDITQNIDLEKDFKEDSLNGVTGRRTGVTTDISLDQYQKLADALAGCVSVSVGREIHAKPDGLEYIQNKVNKGLIRDAKVSTDSITLGGMK